MFNDLRSEVWHCMSEVMEGGIKYVKSPGDIYRCEEKPICKVSNMSIIFVSSAVQPVLYKAVFHGGLKSMWSSVMEVRLLIIFKPSCECFNVKVGEMRRMGRCIQDHDQCVEHSILSQYL